MSLVGKQAPDFTAKAVIKDKIVDSFSLSHFSGNYLVLLFYPLDFTYVCPTELLAFQERSQEFEERKAKVIALSVDSAYTHMAWLSTPRARGGIEGVSFPIVADLNKEISRDYGVLLPKEGVALRGLFLVDPSGIIRHETINDLPIGRSVDEILRVIDAVRHHTENGEVCPANWSAGKAAMKPTQQGVEAYFAKTTLRK